MSCCLSLACGVTCWPTMSTTPQTPVDRWYHVAHERDQYLDFTQMQTCATALDVSRYGAYVQVETSASGSYNIG